VLKLTLEPVNVPTVSATTPPPIGSPVADRLSVVAFDQRVRGVDLRRDHAATDGLSALDATVGVRAVVGDGRVRQGGGSRDGERRRAGFVAEHAREPAAGGDGTLTVGREGARGVSGDGRAGHDRRATEDRPASDGEGAIDDPKLA
jgi:hypothetical protein